jgi:hypothetical protein
MADPQYVLLPLHEAVKMMVVQKHQKKGSVKKMDAWHATAVECCRDVIRMPGWNTRFPDNISWKGDHRRQLPCACNSAGDTHGKKNPGSR